MIALNSPTNCLQSFRLELRSGNNSDFPSQANDDFASAMRSNSTLISRGKVEISCNRASRAKAASNSPFAVAYEYIHIITNVFNVFLGIQPRKSYLLHNKKNHSMYYKQKKKFGLFGYALAAIGMNETSQRGALHHHLCAWLGLHSRLLEAAAAFPDLVKEIGKVIDSQFSAEIEGKYHVLDLLSTFMTKSTIQNKPKQTFSPPALQCRPCIFNDTSNPDGGDSAFKEICSYNVSRLNIHHHSFTCFKGGSGKAGCRMSFPQPLIEQTVPVQLTANEENGTNTEKNWRVCDNIISTQFHNIIYPKLHERITVYELKRGKPFILQNIPIDIEIGDDDTLQEYVLNLFRNIIAYGDATSETNHKNPNVKAIMEWLSMLTGKTILKLYRWLQKDIPSRNGLVVPFNDVITTVLGCNTSIQFLGNQEQSKNTLFYLAPYLTKDNVSLSNCISVIKKSYDDVTTNPSKAVDTGTDLRFAKHMNMRILNMLDTKMEISDTQAAAALLGMEAQVVTDTFWYINPSHHIEYVKLCIAQQPNLMNFNDTDENLICPISDDDESDSLSISSDESDDSDTSTNSVNEIDFDIPQSIEEMFVDNFPEVMNDSYDDTIHQNKVLYVKKAGRGKIFKRTKGLPEVSIQIGYHYFYRGEHFADFNRIEYYTLVQIVERKSTIKVGNRGVKSVRFDFAPGHVLFESHVQMIKFHQPTPIFANHTHKPKQPGKEVCPNHTGYKDFIKKANAFALYYLTMFRPESEHFNATDKPNKYKYDWTAFKTWVKDLEADTRIISHCRIIQLQTHIDGLATTKSLRTVAKNYRDRERRIWTQREREQFRLLEKNANLGQNSPHSGFDQDDYDMQHSMTIHQFRIAVKMTTYGLSQMSLLHDLCPIESQSSQNFNSHTAQDICETVYRQSNDIDLIENACSLYQTNMRTIDNTVSDDSPSLLDENIFETPLDANAENETEYRNRIITETITFVRESIERKKNITLGKSQRDVIEYWIDELCAIKTAKHFGIYDDNYKMPLILMLGLPGTGKSFVIDAISECVSYLHLGDVLKTAHYGVAAMNISGSTIHKLFKINFQEGTNSKTELRDQDLIDLQNRLKSDSLFMLVIDEISNVPPHLLHRINRRLQAIRNCTKPFGGLAVFLVGDFLQKKPPGSTPLVHGLMYMVVMEDIDVNRNNSAFVPKRNFPYKGKRPDGLRDPTSNTYLGLKLFEKFQLVSLKEQQRASEDNEHMKLLEKMSQHKCKVTVEDLNLYEHLSKKDMDSDFQNACFIVSTNRERHNISFHMAQLFAIRHKCPIIRWNLKIKGWLNRPSINEELDLLDKDPIFYDHFVQGIDCYLTENINTPLMIGNGTKVKQHSLVFETQEHENHVADMILNSRPGQIITLPFTPLCINVELYHDFLDDDIRRQLKHSSVPLNQEDSAATEKIVISLLKSKHGTKLRAMPTIVTNICYTPARVFLKSLFPLQLGAAVTVDKAQGRTLDKVVACLSRRNDNLYEMDINSIFVTLSRVRRRSDLRLLIHRDSTTLWNQLNYIENLSHDREYFDYMGGFEHNNEGERNHPKIWNRTKALDTMARTIHSTNS